MVGYISNVAPRVCLSAKRQIRPVRGTGYWVLQLARILSSLTHYTEGEGKIH